MKIVVNELWSIFKIIPSDSNYILDANDEIYDISNLNKDEYIELWFNMLGENKIDKYTIDILSDDDEREVIL